MAAGTSTTRDDAVARIRAEYATYARKSAAVHEAKLAMARAALKRAERAGEGAREARDAVERLERARDDARRELDEDMARDVADAEAAREETQTEAAAARAAIERHLEAERAKAAEAEATTREALRPRASEEERATYEEADEYRTTSPEGKGLREAVGEGEGEGEARASAFSRVRGLLTKKASISRASEDVAEAATKTTSGRVSMAALAPKPALVSELAPKPVESTAPEAGATERAFDPHDALLRRLKSSSLKSDSGESRARAAEPAEPATRSERETRSVAPRAQQISDPFAPPRGLGAAIDAIVENKGSATAAQSIESAFGMPNAPEARVSVAPKSILEPSRARDDVFAPETKRVPPALPAAPVRVEPNPYVMSKQDLRPAPRRRVGFPSAYRNTHSTQAPIEVHEREASRDQYSPDANVGETTDAARRRGRDLALTPSNQLSPPVTADSNESSAQRPELKPKIPRILVPSSPFKISEVRNLFSFARHGRYGELKKLIMKGVPLDARDEMGNTALIIACQNGQGRCVKLLIRSGADPNVQNKHGNTSLHFSLHFRFDAISDFLQRHGGLTNIQNLDGQTCYEFVG